MEGRNVDHCVQPRDSNLYINLKPKSGLKNPPVNVVNYNWDELTTNLHGEEFECTPEGRG